MANAKPSHRKMSAGGKTATEQDPMLEEDLGWVKEMEEVLSPFWAARSGYPAAAPHVLSDPYKDE